MAKAGNIDWIAFCGPGPEYAMPESVWASPPFSNFSSDEMRRAKRAFWKFRSRRRTCVLGFGTRDAPIFSSV